MLTTHLASAHPTLDLRLLTLHRLSISGMSLQSAIYDAGYPAEQSEWRGYRRDNPVIVPPKVQVFFPAEGADVPRTLLPMIYSPFSIHSSLHCSGGVLQPEVQVFFLHSSRTYQMFFRARSTRQSELFLIVFLESKVVKSRFSTPIYGRPTRAPRPNVHIWPPLNLQKASKSAFFNGEVESAVPPLDAQPSAFNRATAQCVRYQVIQLSDSSTRRRWDYRMYYSNLIRIRIAQCGIMPQLRTSARRLADVAVGTRPQAALVHICETTRRCFPLAPIDPRVNIFPS